ncbi:33 kDa dynein arm light chain, axonemal, putative [Eimeria mitis]|uniref:33 kDa dynein arm light chain, axonemal, putative n=1 Tax=Eimeria mitis TaxID=44415 RepID=U6K732_9EIME|nr:33 kDa dynein arm light chain, axonemal, putative [Eimeria mitis]CDJ33774.1 33 kDa dynein arm light chain, axonemal, putative [Eimeria mitis]
MILDGPPRPTLVRYGPCIEIAIDSPEAAALLSEGCNTDSRDAQAVIERVRRDAQGSRISVEAVLDALFPPIIWREGDRLFVQARLCAV